MGLFLCMIGKAQSDKKIYNDSLVRFYANEVKKYIDVKEPDTLKYNDLRTEIHKLNLPFCDSLVLYMGICVYDPYQNKQNWQKYSDFVLEYVKFYAHDNYMSLDNFAWMFHEYTNDTILLDTAMSWVKHSVEINPNAENTFTYTALLYKRGKKAEAKIMEEKTIELSWTEEGVDRFSMEKLLRKIRR